MGLSISLINLSESGNRLKKGPHKRRHINIHWRKATTAASRIWNKPTAPWHEQDKRFNATGGKLFGRKRLKVAPTVMEQTKALWRRYSWLWMSSRAISQADRPQSNFITSHSAKEKHNTSVTVCSHHLSVLIIFNSCSRNHTALQWALVNSKLKSVKR